VAEKKPTKASSAAWGDLPADGAGTGNGVERIVNPPAAGAAPGKGLGSKCKPKENAVQEQRTSFPHSLPSGGPRAAEWALDALFGPCKDQAWVAAVRDFHAAGEWAGARYASGSTVFDDDAGCYVNQTIVRKGGRRTDADSVSGAFIFFDDVGDMAASPQAKIDAAWMETFAPEPTLVVETSPGNFQWFYGFDKPCPMDVFKRLTDGLKAHPRTRGGFKDHSGLVRYGRLPSGINPKPGRGAFKTRLTKGSGRVQGVDELARAFGISLDAGAGHSDPAKHPVDQCSLQELEALLLGVDAPLRNHWSKGFDDREAYFKLIAWIKGATGGSADGLDLAERWAAEWTTRDADGNEAHGLQNPEDEVEKRWNSIHDPRGGASGLRDWARRVDPVNAARVWARHHPLDEPQGLNALDGAKIPYGRPGTTQASGDNLEEGLVHRWMLPRTVLPGLDRGEVTLVAGKTGAFKSVYVLQTAIAIACGRPDILGYGAGELERRGDCLIFANEDTRDANGLRSEAILKLHKIDLAAPRFGLGIRGERGFVRDPKTKAISWNKAAVDVIAERRKAGRDIAMIAFDTLAGTICGGSEETNMEFQAVADMALDMARRLNACVVLVHHVKKGEYGDEDIESIRGGSALGNSVRNALILSKPSREEAKLWGTQASRRLTGVTNPKRAHGRLIDKKWFRLTTENVVGESDLAPGVDTPWQSVGLVLDNGGKGPDRSVVVALRDALLKIATRIDQPGETVLVAKRGRGRPDTVQGVLGVTDAEAARTVDELVAAGFVTLESTVANGNGKTTIHVTDPGRKLLALNVNEIGPMADEIPY